MGGSRGEVGERKESMWGKLWSGCRINEKKNGQKKELQEFLRVNSMTLSNGR